jgi:hypothetical protein
MTMATTRTILAGVLAALLLPPMANAQLPSADAAKAQASAAEKQAAASGSAAAADAKQAGADTKAAAGSTTEELKGKAKDAGKTGVGHGATSAKTNVKPIVGDQKATAVEATVTDKGGAGVDKGVDKAAEKIEGAVK